MINQAAVRDLDSLTASLRARIFDLLMILEAEGKLEMPFAKKINAQLFEIRIKYKGQWRILYAYYLKHNIIVLSVFLKKTQKTPKQEIEKAMKRLKSYEK
jgi:phage-related protein